MVVAGGPGGLAGQAVVTPSAGTASGPKTKAEEPFTYGAYRSLRIREFQSHPLIDQLHIVATVLPGSQLLVSGKHRNYFGWRLALFQPQATDARGLPVYDAGTTLRGLAGTQFRAVGHNGQLDLFAKAEGTPFGEHALIIYPSLQATGTSWEWREPLPVLVGGNAFSETFGERLAGWHVGDLDGDAIPDLLVAVLKPGTSYWPDNEGMWAGVERTNSGRGRGYDLQGKWLGQEGTAELYWAKGIYQPGKPLEFSEKRSVHTRQPGFAAQWKSYNSTLALGSLDQGGQRFLVLAGDVDAIVAVPYWVDHDTLLTEDARPLLADGQSLAATFLPQSITSLPSDRAGVHRLLLDGNPGHLVVLEGSAIGSFAEIGSLTTTGGPLTADTLVTPVRCDWDGDGCEDLLAGDASGFLNFWRGTEDPWIYQAPIRLRAGNRIVHHQAGLNGSIQGPSERRWGYLQPTVGDWDEDGNLDLITNDINAELTLYSQASESVHLTAPRRFLRSGTLYRPAWRSRPAILPSRLNFDQRGLPALLHLDWDGDLAVAIPEQRGSLNIVEVIKLTYDDHQPMRLCGPAGFWGRAELCVTDWNGDGKWDVVFGTNRASHRFFTDERLKGSTPLWLENVGTNEHPRFRRAKAIRLKSGEAIYLGVHTASVWVTSLGTHRGGDLIVGAEDGKVYGFPRTELAVPSSH